MFSYVGVMVFGNLPYSGTAGAINEHVNFSNFLFALQTLYRIATADNWSNILQAMVVVRGCSGSAWRMRHST